MIVRFCLLINIVCIIFLVLPLVSGTGKSYAMEIFPEVAGNKPADSVTLTFETFDTTALPILSNPDSLKILRFGPDGTLFDSLGENDGRVTNIREGSYRVRLRGSDGSASLGDYSVRVYAFLGGQIRGAASCGYYVIENNWNSLDTIIKNIKAVRDTLDDGFASQSGQSNLDAAVSSRSTLTSSDNIGINWQDIDNVGSLQFLPNTVIGSVSSMVLVDSAKLARAVWDNDLVAEAARTVDLSLCQGAGAGQYPCSLYVFSETDSSALQGVSVRIMNNDQNSTIAVGLSNSAGLVSAYLDSAQYKIWAYRAGVEFAGLPDSIVVQAPSVNDTLWGGSFDPGSPSQADLCLVYGWVYDLSGVSLSGVTVTARLMETSVRHQDMILSPFYKTAVSDSTGFWSLEVYPSAGLTPADSKYEFTIYFESGRILRREVLVPDLSSWKLSW